MPPQAKPGGAQPRLPAFPRTDRRRVIEQPVILFLCREPRESAMKRMVGRQECLLAVQDGRVGGAGIVEALDLAGAERELDAAGACRVRVGLEVGMGQTRNLAGMAVPV